MYKLFSLVSVFKKISSFSYSFSVAVAFFYST